MTLTPTSSRAGGGTAWTEQVLESGASLANWTQVSGTWSVVSNAFHVDTTGGTAARLKYNTSLDQYMNGLWQLSVEIKLTSVGSGNDAPAGLLWYWPGAAAGSPTAQLLSASAAGARRIRGEMDATIARLDVFTPAPTWTADAFVELKIVGMGARVQVSLAGVNVGSCDFGAGPGQDLVPEYGHTAATFVGLVCNNAVWDFQTFTFSYLPLS